MDDMRVMGRVTSATRSKWVADADGRHERNGFCRDLASQTFVLVLADGTTLLAEGRMGAPVLR